MSLGEKLIELRKQKNLSQEKVAEELKVTRQTISNWELDQTVPDLEQSKELSRLYQISLDELVDNDIREVLTERVSNTEQLAGLIIKILKGLVIAFFCLIGALLLASLLRLLV
jgi:Predicted transcriptional regulators